MHTANAEMAPVLNGAPARRTLLIVDDEEGPRQSLRVVFKEEYNLLMANDGARAIELAKQNRIDVAITDIRMVGMSGVELLEHLKAVDAGIEVIMLTAYETVDTLRLALRLGACDYLNKPFDISTMRKAVASAMERRSLGEEIRNNGQQLQELQKELQNQKMTEEITRTRGEIYASIIHDINGPLTVISGFIQLMSQRIGPGNRVEGEDLDFIKDRLRTITRQVTNCIEISRRYLSFLRQNSEENPPVGVNHILADLHQLLRVHPAA
jgi:two-component system, sensor histidine kinase and response regulator